jgi:hypothetical protein
MNTKSFIEHPDSDVVTVAELAERFSVERSVCRKWLAKEGFRTRRIRLEEKPQPTVRGAFP